MAHEFDSKSVGIPQQKLWFDEYVYTSALLQSQLPNVREFLQVNEFPNIAVSLVLPIQQSTRIVWINFYDENGFPHATNAELPVPRNSNHLKLLLSYDSESARASGHPAIGRAVNQLRLFFGVPVAHELIWHHQYDEDAADRRFFSPLGYASHFGGQHINNFSNFEQVRPISTEVSILLSKAFEQRFPEEQFILLWLAFEALVNENLPGDSNGSKRRKYFSDTLQSDVVNAEVFRLFKIRSELFKEGKVDDRLCGEACWSLYMAIQLVTLNNGDLRTSLVQGYESYINGRPT